MLTIPIVAWGKHHVDTARFCLASLMSEGNLPDVEAHVKIYTDEPSAFQGYETAPIKNMGGGKHQITTNCFIDALSEGHPIVPIAADMVASSGMLSALEEHAKTKRLVMVPVLRTDASRMLPILEGLVEQNVPLGSKGRLSLAPRDLCSLAFENIHPTLLLQFLENIPAVSYPTTIYSRHGNTISARCFHMHPLLLRPADIRHVTPSIDGEMVSRVPEHEIHIVTDSDEMVVCDISEPDYNWNGPGKAVVDTLAFVNRKTINRHRWFFTHECFLHAGEIEKCEPDPRMKQLLADVASLPSR